MAMSESEIQQRIQLEGPRYSCILMRNNSGMLKNKDGTPVRYGLGQTSKNSMKSSDLIGITSIVVTADMVGETIGVFTAVEVKSEDWKGPTNEREKSQEDFIKWVKSRGGLASFAKSVDEFKQLMQLL